MRLKKLLTLAVAGALFIGGVITANAAELDTAWYAKQNPDVVAALGNSPEAMKLHYDMFGRKEGRMANTRDVEAQLRRLFKAEEYATRYPDIKAAFGADVEAMFQHYISFGLLEGRRPSEKVSQEAAISLKKTVEKAMADAGIAAVPGSPQLVEVITGTVAADKGGAAVQQALTNAAPAIEKAVAETAKEATAPASSPSGGSNSSSSSSSNTGTPSTPVTPVTPDDPITPEETVKDAIWATLADHDSESDTTLSEKLTKLNEDKPINSNVGEGKIVNVSFNDGTAIPKHKNKSDATEDTCWVGIGVPYLSGYTYEWGWAADNEYTGFKDNSSLTEKTNQMTANGQDHATFYWGWNTKDADAKNYGLLKVKKGDALVAEYHIDFSSISIDDTSSDD